MLSESSIWNGYIPKPVDRTPEHATNESILNQWSKQLSIPGLHTLYDLDENFFDTVLHWINVTNAFLERYAHLPHTALPAVDEVCQKGGPSKYYPTYFSHVFPSSERYEILADELRYRRAGNRFGKSMCDDVPRVIAVTQRFGSILGAITARPATRVVIEATKRQLHDAQFPDMHILYKPPAIPLIQASGLKLTYLSALAEYTQRKGHVVLIDDSISTAKLIQQYNYTHTGIPIIQIVNGSGRLTKPILDRKEFINDPEHGIFIMPTWNDLEQTLQNVQTTITSRGLSS